MNSAELVYLDQRGLKGFVREWIIWTLRCSVACSLMVFGEPQGIDAITVALNCRCFVWLNRPQWPAHGLRKPDGKLMACLADGQLAFETDAERLSWRVSGSDAFDRNVSLGIDSGARSVRIQLPR